VRDDRAAQTASSCGRASDQARTVAFRLAAAVAFVDERVAQSQVAALEVLASALHVGADESHEILADSTNPPRRATGVRVTREGEQCATCTYRSEARPGSGRPSNGFCPS